MCRRFTGPHSVLQIFLEKIFVCISSMIKNLKEYTKNLTLWVETKKFLRSTSADSNLLITNKTGSNYRKQNNVHETTVVRFKPLTENVQEYTMLLEEIQNQYLLIMKKCSPTISKQFTNLTSVINEGNSVSLFQGQS